MNLLRDAAGSSNAASEVIPGFLWVGSSLSAKASVFYQMEFSLIICCGTELRNPAPKPPNYRCRKAQLDETPPEPPDTPGGGDNNDNISGETSNDFVESIIHIFDQVHDWIETERVYSERSVESDMPIPVYRGATDVYGRPLSKYDNGYPKKSLNERYKIVIPFVFYNRKIVMEDLNKITNHDYLWLFIAAFFGVFIGNLLYYYEFFCSYF